MGLDLKEVTPEAKAFGKAIFDRVAAWESAAGRRRRARRADAQATFELAARRLAAGLVENARKDPMRWGYYVQSAGSFSGEAISYRAVTAAKDAFLGLGLIEQLNGYSLPSFSGRQIGRAARVRAISNFLMLAAEYGVHPEDAQFHYLRRLPARPLVLKSSSKVDKFGRKIGGRALRFERSGRALKLEKDIKELNRFLNRSNLENGVHRGYRRIFNMGDHENFDWNKGGRLYGQGEDNYQRLKSADRQKMKIDGEPVVEIDIRASYLTILHSWSGVPLQDGEDPYDVEGIPRPIVKTFITMTLGHDKFHRRWPKELKEKLIAAGFDLVKEFKLKSVHERVLEAQPLLREWPQGTISWADLMFAESEAVVNCMLRLMREYSAPSLSVHDSIIVKRSDAALASRVLSEEYEKSCGVRPTLKASAAIL